MKSDESEAELDAAVRDALQAQVGMRKAPDILRAAIRRSIRAESESGATTTRAAPRSTYRTVTRIMAIAAMLALLIGGSWQLASRRAEAGLVASEVLTGHIRSLMGSHLTDILTSDQHTVKPWFDGKLDYSPPVSDFAGRGYPLVGGRLDYIGDRAVAALVYARRQHLINLFLWPAGREASGSAPVETRQGYHLLHWSTAQYTYWVVSDLGTAELSDFAQLIRDADEASEGRPESGVRL